MQQQQLLLLRSRFSHVRLCAIPQAAAHQAPPSLGFSRQEPRQHIKKLRPHLPTKVHMVKAMDVRWRRKRQPTPVFLPRESCEQRSLVGCRLWDRTESDMTEAT